MVLARILLHVDRIILSHYYDAIEHIFENRTTPSTFNVPDAIEWTEDAAEDECVVLCLCVIIPLSCSMRHFDSGRLEIIALLYCSDVKLMYIKGSRGIFEVRLLLISYKFDDPYILQIGYIRLYKI